MLPQANVLQLSRRCLQLFLLLVLLSGPLRTHACDVCNLFIGVQPNDRFHRLSLFYRYSAYGGYRNVPGTQVGNQRHPLFGKTLHDPSLHVQEPTYSDQDRELYHTWELRGQFFLAQRWQLLVNVPFQYAEFRIEQERTRAFENGDPTLLLQYSPIWRESGQNAHRLQVGGGVVLPTGRYAHSRIAETAHLYPGRGAWSGLLSVGYVHRWNKLGASLNATYRLNTTNRHGFRSTNALNLQADLFYGFRLDGPEGRVQLQPQAGTWYEDSGGDYLHGEWIAGTGGRLLFATTGINLVVERFNVQANLWLPLHQELFGTQLGNGGRLVMGLGYAFGGAPSGEAGPIPAATSQQPAE